MTTPAVPASTAAGIEAHAAGAEAGHERRERGLLALLRRRRQRAVGPAVEAALGDDERPAGPRLARELERRLVGLGARVGEVDPPADRAGREALGQAGHRVRPEQVGDVDEPRGLVGDRRHDRRVAVPDVADGDPAEEVEVLAPLGVPQPGALSAHELDVVAGVVAHHRVAGAHRAGRTFVPTPASVKSSSSSECGTRPSTMWANGTPPWMASRQACSLGRIPPATLVEHGLDLVGGRLGDHRPDVGRVAQPARDVGEEHDLVGARARGRRRPPPRRR